MVWLPGGTFVMGQDDSQYEDERPAHPVQVDAFAVGQYPVTFAAYDRFCEATRRRPAVDEGWGRGERPVINVSWADVHDYCTWLSRETGETYGLATEEQWEYACRAGSTTRYCFGDDPKGLADYAWYDVNAKGRTHPVGQKRPNAWHLYDMHGNVREWCQNGYDTGNHDQRLVDEIKSLRAEAAASHMSQATSIDLHQRAAAMEGYLLAQADRFFRGGSWRDPAGYCRSASRKKAPPDDRLFNLGFRLVRTGPWSSHPLTRVVTAPAPSRSSRSR
jgi:formylglycine-generating enzyme required for sulfatase activity